MAVHDFITSEQIEAVPEDPAMAFAELVGIVEKRLSKLCNPYIGVNEQEAWDHINDYRHGFENVVIGLARAFKIEPFASRDVPRRGDFGGSDYQEFRADLDHYLTQLGLAHLGQAIASPLLEWCSLKPKYRGLKSQAFHFQISAHKPSRVSAKIEKLFFDKNGSSGAVVAK
jgi:hypothetical protein